jgi:hypothetical protein
MHVQCRRKYSGKTRLSKTSIPVVDLLWEKAIQNLIRLLILLLRSLVILGPHFMELLQTFHPVQHSSRIYLLYGAGYENVLRMMQALQPGLHAQCTRIMYAKNLTYVPRRVRHPDDAIVSLALDWQYSFYETHSIRTLSDLRASSYVDCTYFLQEDILVAYFSLRSASPTKGAAPKINEWFGLMAKLLVLFLLQGTHGHFYVIGAFAKGTTLSKSHGLRKQLTWVDALEDRTEHP